MKFVIVSADGVQLQALARRFRKRFGDEAEVITADSGIYALSVCERDLPTLIISTQHLGDMSGLELYKIIRQDISLQATPFILLDTTAITYPHLLPIDRILKTEASAVEVMRATFELITRTGLFFDERSRERHAPQGTEAAKASGTLEVLTLFDLCLSLSQSKQSGKLLLLFAEKKAWFLFKEGLVINAEMGRLSGEEAITATFKAANEHPKAEFFFEKLDKTSLANTSPICASIDEMLLKVAVELDHSAQTDPYLN
jgi:CheY-like chemotaxis protein